MNHALAIFISGSGTTMEAMLQELAKGELPLRVACVIASNKEALGITKAKKYLPQEKIFVINPNDFRTPDTKIDHAAFGNALLTVLQKTNATVITQNGWLPKTPQNVIKAFENRIFNQHPGPLPETAGQYGRMPLATMLYLRKKQKRDWRTPTQSGWTEVVAQRVGVAFDAGAIVKLSRVPIKATDTVKTLQRRLLPIEHQLQIALLHDIVNDSVKEISEKAVIILPGEESLLTEAKSYARELYPKG